MGMIEEKYNIYYLNDRRIYIEDLSKKLLLENTIPYMFEYKDIRIYDSAWNRITLKILEAIDELNPMDSHKLLELQYKWSNSPVFSEYQYSNFQPFKDIYLNTNHTATHAGMNIQLLLTTYGIPLEECKMHIRRHPQAEPTEVREYCREITISGLKKVLMLAGLSQKSMDTTFGNMEVINKRFLSQVSKGFNDFYLFDDYNYFVNYKQKTLEYLNKKYYGTPYVGATVRGLRYLDIYYKNKKLFDNFEKIELLIKNKETFNNEICYLFEQSPIKAISIRKLMSRLKIINPEFMSQLTPFDNSDSFYALINALFCIKYYFKKPFIALDDKISLSYDDLIMSYLYTMNNFTVSIVNKYADKMHLKRPDSYLNLFKEISEDYVQVDVDKCVSRDVFLISDTDLNLIKKELVYYINSFGKINTKEYNGYSQLPKIGYLWNKHLIAGLIRTYFDSLFSIECTSNVYDLTDYIITLK